jgi:protocatechuate 3,4-dioxygenase beta subunit
VTDDLGAYRIAGLLPGEYVVSAVPRDSVASAAANADSLRQRQAEILAAARAKGNEAAMQAQFDRARREQGRDPARPPERTGYVAVYHPSSVVPGTAGRVRLGVSEQVSAVDIQLQVVDTGVVSGLVTGPQGTPVAARVQLLDPAMPIANLAVWFRNASSNGRFAFHGIPPGAYVLTAQASAGRPGEELTAAASVQVAEAGEHEVALALRGGVPASGRIDLASLGSAVDLRKLQVDLMRVMTPAEWEAPLGTATPDAEGRFVIRGLFPGRYRVGVRGLPDGWMLASAVFDDVDAADYHLQIEDRPFTGGVVSVTSRVAQLTGMVSGTNGDPVSDHSVLLFPSDRELWVPQSRRIHVAQPGVDGRYTIRGLPPGEYRLAAVTPPETGQQFDPEFLAQAMSGSTSVTIAAGEQKTQDIRVTRR